MAGVGAFVLGLVVVAGLVPAASSVHVLAPDLAWSVVQDLAAAQHYRDPLVAAAKLKGLPIQPVQLATTTDLHRAVHDAERFLGLRFTPAEHAQVDKDLKRLTPDLAREVAEILSATTSLGRHIKIATAVLTPLEMEKINAAIDEQEIPPEINELLGKVNQPLILSATIAMMDLIEAAVPRLQKVDGGEPDLAGCNVIATPVVAGITVLAVGLPGPSCFNMGATVLSVDVDGDDVYNNLAGVAGTALGVVQSIAIDIGGNDGYNVEQAGGIGLAIGIVANILGDDEYQSFSGLPQQASGRIGIGYLLDLGGSNEYSCREWCQGFGTGESGIGILWNPKGNGTYSMSHGEGQGFGRSNGLGMVLGSDGTDTYQSLGLAQGQGKLLGIGVLVDPSGTDNYAVATATARASSNPATGSGLFFDFSGDDGYDNISPGAENSQWGASITTSAPMIRKGVDCEFLIDPSKCVPVLP